MSKVVGVLNLIITGIPSIPQLNDGNIRKGLRFKPYYNWNTFNTVSSSIEAFRNYAF